MCPRKDREKWRECMEEENDGGSFQGVETDV